MAANANDFFVEAGLPGSATTLSANYTIADTSITVASTTNWPTATGVVFAIDVIDANGERVDGTYNVYQGTVATGTSITNVSHITGSGTDRNYAAGATTRVYIVVASEIQNRLVEGLVVEHNQDGTHGDITATSVTATGAIEATDFVLTGAGGTNGWSTGLPAPNTVTYNGNRSYDLVFNGTDLTDTVSEGMRLRFTRTVSAPTQCTDLEASSSQYFNKTSPAAMTFTDDFVVSAWIKLESYGALSTIASRYNGTSGWGLDINTDGTVRLVGFNASSANYSLVQSYQSVPLNKWIHVAAQLDMSAFTATTTTSYIMLDGVNVPASVSRAGTNPTALVQAGNLEIGSRNATNFFDGKLAQVAIFNAKVTQATMLTYMSQGLSGSETSLISAYSLSNSINDLNTTNANNLTAQNSAAATNVDSPFGNYLGGTLEYGIITKTAFSTNTTLTVQVPEGCAIPTSGGVSAVLYSRESVPYGFVRDAGRWTLNLFNSTSDFTQNSPTATTYYNPTGFSFSIPVGAYELVGKYATEMRDDVGAPSDSCDFALSTSQSAFTNLELVSSKYNSTSGTSTFITTTDTVQSYITNASATTYYGVMVANAGTVTVIQFRGTMAPINVVATPAYL